MAKTIFLIVDGMGDTPIRQLNGKTPLEYAYKPNIVRLSARSSFAFPSVLGRLAPQSDAGVLANLGYDPLKYSTGRGWFECLGLGMGPSEGDLCLRVNFGQTSGGKLENVRVYMSKEELFELENDINSKVKIGADFYFKSGESYRGGLVIKGGERKLSQFVSNNEPGYVAKFFPNGKKLSFASPVKDKKIKSIRPARKEAKYTADLLNKFIKKSQEVIKESKVYKKRIENGLPAPNFLFLRDGAIHDPNLPSINKNYGKKWAAIAGMPLEKGIAEAAGMSVLDIEERSDLTQDIQAKADMLSYAIHKFDCVYIHVKQTDSAAHLGKYHEKYHVIEVMDRILIGRISGLIEIENGDTFVLSCDHSTSSELKRHINSNIPVMITNRGFNNTLAFGESACRKNHIKTIKKADQLMDFVMRL